MRQFIVALLCGGALFTAAQASENVPLSKLAVAPDSFNGQTITVDASMLMLVAQKAMSQCKGKAKGVMIQPSGTMATVTFEACVTADAAMELMDVTVGAPIKVTGTVRIVRSMGILTGIVFDEATIVEAPAAPASTEPTPAPQ